MAIHLTAKIPFNRVVKIGIWNNRTNKKSLNTVYTALRKKYPGKEIYISNGGFFGMDTNRWPCWGLKADGTIVANSWNTSGTAYFAMKDNKIEFHKRTDAFPSAYTDGVSVYPPLVEGGLKSNSFHNGPDGASNRGRTMIGYTGDSIVLSCISDTSGTSDFTLTEAYNYMRNQGCKYAGNLDGGGSTQCNFNGNKITSSRIVSNFVYIVANTASSSGNSSSSKTNNTTNSGTSSSTTFKVGDTVTMKSGAPVYGKTYKFASWVYKSTLYVRAISGSRITISTQKTGAVTGNVDKKYLTKK